MLKRPIPLTAKPETPGIRRVYDQRKRIKPERTGGFFQTLIEPAAVAEIVPIPLMRSCVIRIEFNSPTKFLLRSGEIPVMVQERKSERSVGFCSLLNLQRLSGGDLRPGVSFRGRSETPETCSSGSISQTGIRSRVGRIFLNRHLKVLRTSLYGVWPALVPVVSAFEIRFVSLGVHGTRLCQLFLFPRGQLSLNSCCYCACDLRLQV